MSNSFGGKTCNRITLDTSEGRRVLWIETGIILFLVAAPTIAWIACWLLWGSDYLQLNKQILYLAGGTSTSFAIGSMERIFSSLRLVPVVLFIMWRSGDEWSRFGFVKPKLEKDILIGLGLFLIMGVIHEMNWVIKLPSHHWTWSRFIWAPIPIDRVLLLSARSIAVGFSEELTVRGYLIPRFETLFGSTWKSILFSAIVFGLLHINKGLGGAVMSGLSGVIWGIGFCATRRIWPVVTSHSLWDFVVATHLDALLTM